MQDYFPVPAFARVQYLHKSVYDFLKAENIQAMLNEQVPDHFKDGRILHQLDLARLKLGVLSTDASDMYLCLEEIAAASLKEAHPVLTKTFVQGFEDVLLHYYWSTNTLMNNADILSALAAFDCTQYIDLVLTNSIKTGVIHFKCTSMLVAAIGQSPLNKFTLSATNLKLVELILRVRQCQVTSKDYAQTTRSRDSFTSDVWPTLLKTLAFEVSGNGRDNSVGSFVNNASLKVSRHAWLVVKLFLSYIASGNECLPLLWRFCSKPQPCNDESHEHQWERADVFLRTHMPVAWRNELKDVRIHDRLVDRPVDRLIDRLIDDSELEWCI
jgi:hypothetical protein